VEFKFGLTATVDNSIKMFFDKDLELVVEQTIGEVTTEVSWETLNFTYTDEASVLLSYFTSADESYYIATFSIVDTGTVKSSLVAEVNIRFLLANVPPPLAPRKTSGYFEVLFHGVGLGYSPSAGILAGDSPVSDLFNSTAYSDVCNYWATVVCNREALTFLNQSCLEDELALVNPFIVQNYHADESKLHLSSAPLVVQVGVNEVFERPSEEPVETSYSGFTLVLIGSGGVLCVILSVAVIFRLRKKRTGQKMTVLTRPSQEENVEIELDDILRYEDEHDD
jgi:hypothetical protein